LELPSSRVHQDDEYLPELAESKDQYESKWEENSCVRDEPNEGATRMDMKRWLESITAPSWRPWGQTMCIVEMRTGISHRSP